MPRITSKRKSVDATAVPGASGATGGNNGAAAGDVMTLAEAAAYLRLAEDEVVRLVWSEGLLGRQVGKEWRFLKAAIQDWLRTPKKMTSDEAIMASAGKFKDDPFLEEIVREAYRQRGLPIAEEGQ